MAAVASGRLRPFRGKRWPFDSATCEPRRLRKGSTAQTEPTAKTRHRRRSFGKRSESGGTPDGCGMYFPLRSNGFAQTTNCANPPIPDWRVDWSPSGAYMCIKPNGNLVPNCIFCLNAFSSPSREETVEHVFSEAIGGRFTISRVCKPCNNYLGTKVDTTISESSPCWRSGRGFESKENGGKFPIFWDCCSGTPTSRKIQSRNCAWRGTPIRAFPRYTSCRISERRRSRTA